MVSFWYYIQTMEIIIDNIAIWRADFHEGYTVREIPPNIAYQDKDGLMKRSDKIMYRYAKNYKVGDTAFVLFVRTYESSKKKVEKQLDTVAKKVDEKKALKFKGALPSNFDYLNIYLKGEK